MVIRPVKGEDAQALFDMMCLLDGETPFMMYEPGERREKAEINGFRKRIDDVLGSDFLLAAEGDKGERNRRLYLGGERETEPCFAHGVSCCGRPGGVPEPGNRRDKWARENGIVRLELTVECANGAAKHLYEKNGFVVEGRREKSMKWSGEFVDEFYMAKLL